MLDFIGKDRRWDVWEGAQAGFELLDLMTEEIEKEKLLWFVGGTEMDDLRVVGTLGIKKTLWSGSCERNRLKWVRIKTVFEP